MASNSKKTVILLLAPLPPDGKPGGIGTWTITMLDELSRRSDYDTVHVDTAVKWRSTTDKRLYKRLVGGVLQGTYDCVRAGILAIKHKPDVMHLCTSGSFATLKDILILASQKIIGVRTVIHYHMGRLPAIIAENGFQWKIIRVAIALADAVVVIDKKSELSLENTCAHKLKRIPNAINPNHFAALHTHDPRPCLPARLVHIVFIGWAIPAKGLRELVSACVNLMQHDLKLTIVGPIEPPFRSELKRAASKRGSCDWIDFTGPVEYSESLRYMRDADVFVLPSYTEGFPYVITEAMALGKPIIATNVGAIPEMLRDEDGSEYGLLIRPRDEHELTDAMVYLLNHPDEAGAMGISASKRALSLYCIGPIFKQYDSLWKSLFV